MGSWASGRPATKATVESGLILDIGRLLRTHAVTAGAKRTSSLQWTDTESGEATASIGYEADLRDPYNAYVRLRYVTNGSPMDYRIWLRCTPCRFGGFRWWWICPVTRQSVSKLYMPPGATWFASRPLFRMAYRSERGGPIDRSHLRQARIFKKLGGKYRIFEQIPPRRPKGMHRRTYERLLAELRAAEERHETIFTIGTLRLLRKYPEMRKDLPWL